MKIYQCNLDGVWDGIERDAKPDPYNEGEWLVPGGCSIVQPPSVLENKVAVFDFQTNQWSLLTNFVGTVYWLPDRSQHTITEVGMELPEDAVTVEPPPLPPTPQEIEQMYATAIQSFMDAKAQEKRYDNIKSAALRAALPNSPFHSEGLAAGTWMDNCWALSYQIMAEFKAGTRPVPTIEELIEMMPELVW